MKLTEPSIRVGLQYTADNKLTLRLECLAETEASKLSLSDGHLPERNCEKVRKRNSVNSVNS